MFLFNAVLVRSCCISTKMCSIGCRAKSNAGRVLLRHSCLAVHHAIHNKFKDKCAKRQRLQRFSCTTLHGAYKRIEKSLMRSGCNKGPTHHAANLNVKKRKTPALAEDVHMAALPEIILRASCQCVCKNLYYMQASWYDTSSKVKNVQSLVEASESIKKLVLLNN